MNELYFFLPGILLLGIITSYEDIKYGKIRNKWVIGAIAYGLIVYVGLFMWDYFSGTHINYFHIAEVGLNTVIALLLGFLFWYFKIWTAGDGKLFFAFTLMIPLSAYTKFYVNYFPAFNLLINVFVPLFFVFLIITLIKTKWKEKKNTIAKTFELKQLLTFIVYIFALFGVMKFITTLIKVNLSFIVMAVFILVFMYLFRALFKEKTIIIMAVISVLCLILDRSIYSLHFLQQFVILVCIGLVINVLIKISSDSFIYEKKISELTDRDILMEFIYLNNKSYKKKYIDGALNNLKTKEHKIPESKRIMNVKIIRKAYKQGKIAFKTIKVQQTVPFAPAIFLGVLLTIILKSNIIASIVSWL